MRRLVIWPLPMHQRSLKTRLESPEFKAVRGARRCLCNSSPAVAAWRKQLQSETRDWEQTAAIIARFSKINAEDLQ